MPHCKAAKTYAWLLLLLFCSMLTFMPRSNAADGTVLYIEPKNQTVGADEVFNVTINIANLPSPNGAVGFEFAMLWDPNILEAINMTEVLFHSIMPESEWDNIWNIQHIVNATGGYMKYVYLFLDNERAVSGGYAPISGNQTMAAVTFRGKTSGLATVSFPDPKFIKIGTIGGDRIPAQGIGGSVTVGNPSVTITILSPENTTYNTRSINLTVDLSKEVEWLAYSLDGNANVSFSGSVILSAPDGRHTVIVYGNDTIGQMGSSNTTYFAVDATPPDISFSQTPPQPTPEMIFGTYKWKFFFDASATTDAVSQIQSYFWDFGDGTNATGINATHIYRDPGQYTLTLRVTDTANNTGTSTVTFNLDPSSAPLEIPYGLLIAIVIPAAWIPVLWLYIRRTRKKRR